MSPTKDDTNNQDDDVAADVAAARGDSTELMAESVELTEYLTTTEALAIEDPEQVAFEIVSRILTGTTVDDILNRQQVMSGEALLGIPIIVARVKWHKSGYDQREAVYALVEGTNAGTGEQVLITCGGRNVMAQLYALNKIDAFPLALKFGKASNPTANGYYPLWLEAAPEVG